MVAKGPFDLLTVGGWWSTSSSLPVDDHAAVIDLDDVGGPTGVATTAMIVPESNVIAPPVT